MAKPIPVFHGVVDMAGVLHMDKAECGMRHAWALTLRNCAVIFTLKKQARPKSTSQLGYLWGVVYPVIAEHFGYCDYEHEAMHDEIMRVLRGLKPDPNPLQIRVSLAEMSHEDVSAYISDVRFWALDKFGIVTPDANQVEAPAPRKKAA